MSVLVLYENFAVAAAVARRLLDMPSVHLVRAGSILVSPDATQYDVVVCCPYLRQQRLDEVLASCRAGGDTGTSVVQLRDDVGRASIVVLAESATGEAAFSAVTHALGASPLRTL